MNSEDPAITAARLATAIPTLAAQGWHWVRDWIFHHDGQYYDLSASNLDMLDYIAANGCSLVDREWALNG